MKIYFLCFLIFLSSDLIAKKQKPTITKESVDAQIDLIFKNIEAGGKTKVKPTEFIKMNDISASEITEVGQIYKTDSFKTAITSFVYSEKPDFLAVIEKGPEGEQIFSDKKQSLARTFATLNTGKKYSAFHFEGTRKDSESKTWYFYHFSGNVIVSDFNEDKKTALIVPVGLNAGIEMGDFIGPLIDNERIVDLQSGQQTSLNESVKILGFDTFEQTYGGQTSFITLEKGTNGGLSLNQVLDIFHVSEQGVSSTVKLTELAGKVQIVDVRPDSAIAYVLSANQRISLGDAVGKARAKK